MKLWKQEKTKSNVTDEAAELLTASLEKSIE